MKVLIDSDVCLDFLTGRKPHFSLAAKLFNQIYETELAAVVSPDSFSNMFYVLNREHEAAKIINQLKALRKLINILPLTENHVDWALNAGWNDFEDAMQHACANENGCEAIITRNIDDYAKATLPVFTPFDYLNR